MFGFTTMLVPGHATLTLPPYVEVPDMATEQSSVDVRRERLMMRAFQNPLVGPVLRKLANPQDIIEDGLSFGRPASS